MIYYGSYSSLIVFNLTYPVYSSSTILSNLRTTAIKTSSKELSVMETFDIPS
jgi:hypothetical protein